MCYSGILLRDCLGVQFAWQPPSYEWLYISVFYSSEQRTYKLWVNGKDTSNLWSAGAFLRFTAGVLSGALAEEYNPELTYESDHVGFHEDAAKGWVPVILDDPRIGGWQGNNGEVARSMDGQMSVFRVWSSEQGGQDSCPCRKAVGLEAYYVFGESSETLSDLNGNHDGTIVGGKFGEDEPLSECVKELRGLAKNTKLTEHCLDEDGMAGAYSAGRVVLVALLIGSVGFGAKKFSETRVPGGGKGGDGLSASIFEMDAGIGGGGAAAPYVPPAASSSTSSGGGGGTIYD